jgi:hypothetical protein
VKRRRIYVDEGFYLDLKMSAARAGKSVIDYTRDLATSYPVMKEKKRKNVLPKF